MSEKKDKQQNLLVKANKKGRHIMPVLNRLRIFILPIVWLLFPFKIYGHKKVADGPFIYVGNHYRLWDIAYPACTTWEGIHFITKTENTKVPILGYFCRKTKAISANRDGNDIRTVMNCLKCLRNGEKISLYPEGTRNKKAVKDFLPFKEGAAMIAIKAKVPIVPVLIYKKTMPFRLNHIIVGEPYELSEFYNKRLSDEDVQKANKIVYETLIRMRDEHADFLAQKKGKKV